MIFNMAGGGSAFDIKVVRNPKPESPKVNTIWADTNTDITDYAFSAAVPENPVPGMVWFLTGTSSPAAFNVLEKGCIMVYPISAKQYIDGAWVSVKAQSYQNDWVDWFMYLYNKGEEYVDEFGNGWTGSGDRYTKEEASLFAGSPSGGADYSGTWTSPFFDATNLTKLEVYVDEYHRGGPESFGKILVIDESGETVVSESLTSSQSDIWAELDISGVTSKKCRVQVTAGHTKSSGQVAYLRFSIVRCC